MNAWRGCIRLVFFCLMVQTGWAADQPAPVENLKIQILDLIFKVEDIGGKVLDLQVKETDIGGKVLELQVKETDMEIRIELAADVLFDFDKAAIRQQAEIAMKQVGAMIKETARGAVRIEGHTDSKGSDTYNQKLSERRANSVRDWLVKKEGLKNVRFATTGFGAQKPTVANTKPDGSDDPAGRQKNRRVEIVIGKKK